MLRGFRKLRIETERMTLRPPIHSDFRPWSKLRAQSIDYLTPWEPAWAEDHLTRKAFTNRVYWAQRSVSGGTALPLFLIRRSDEILLGAITLDNIRRGPAQSGTLGYWTGEPFARQGYMREAITAVVHYAFTRLDLSRIEAACLPENAASRGLLETSGFKYEGVAQSYLQINDRWRTHVLYAALRSDRRGKVPHAERA
ncbi:GNAT family N-acetyltransferase [Roseobacter sp. S98]|uniref:GNAT family N-acetyltransferase n=1 Tax=Roseobacter algicola (ex Choi et al. 2025) (nom. illeg.) TaxID=3092138 RepID=UPI0035C76CDE